MIWNALLVVFTLLRTGMCSSGGLASSGASEKPLFLSQRKDSEAALVLTGTSGTDLTYNAAFTDKPTVVPPNDPRDWLFHVYTTECDAPVTFDIKQDSVLGRVTVPLVSVACVLLALFGCPLACVQGGRGGGGGHESPTLISNGCSGHAPEVTQRPRLYHLDYARITAVMCVIFEHAGGAGYTRRNIGWGLWWAMPFLILTTGIGRAMSKSSPGGYLMRLAVLLIVGVAFNWIADVITSQDWKNDPGNVVFQMFYVIFIMVLYIVSIPLSQALKEVADSTRPNPTVGCNAITITTCIFGFIAVAGNFCVLFNIPINPFGTLSSDWGRYYQQITSHLPLFLAEFSGGWFLVSLACLMESRRLDAGLIGWVLLAYIYVPTVLAPMHQQCYAVWGNLYLFAMVTHVWKLRGSDVIASRVQAYWPLLFMLLCFLAMPDMTGRCDMFPPGYTWERFRHSAGQCLLALIFVAGGFKIEDDPHDVTKWLGWWSLFAYISHVACFRLLGSPYGAIFIFALILPFYVNHRWKKSRREVTTQ